MKRLCVALLLLAACDSRPEGGITLPPANPSTFPAQAAAKSFKAKFVDMGAHCDHMPIMQPGERRQMFQFSVELTNTSDDLALEVRLRACYLSFDAQAWGPAWTDFTRWDETQMKKLDPLIRLEYGAPQRVHFTARACFDENHHNEPLYAVAVFEAHGELLFVRSSSAVSMTQ